MPDTCTVESVKRKKKEKDKKSGTYVRICMFYEILFPFKEGYGQILDFIYTGRGSLQKPIADEFVLGGTSLLLQGC